MMDENEPLTLPLVWVDPEEVDILFVNQVLLQRQGDEVILTFGQQTPPALLGSEQERRERASQISYVPIRTVARFGLPLSRFREFKELISRASDSSSAGDESGE